jgi:3-hydroxyacyl-CoA dehydrogenase
VANIESVTKRPPHLRFNTSAIPLLRLRRCQAARKHYRYALLFTSPCHAVAGDYSAPRTSDTAQATAFSWFQAGQDVHCRRRMPGFYVNRCLTVFGGSLAFVRDGVTLEKLDKAITNFGMPVGPPLLPTKLAWTSHPTWPTFCPRPIWAFGWKKEATSPWKR